MLNLFATECVSKREYYSFLHKKYDGKFPDAQNNHFNVKIDTVGTHVLIYLQL